MGRWIRVHLTSLQLSLFLFYNLWPVVCCDCIAIVWIAMGLVRLYEHRKQFLCNWQLWVIQCKLKWMPLPLASVPCVSLSVFVSLSGRPRLKVAWFSYCSSTLIAFEFLAEVGCHLNACLTSFVFPRPFDPRWIMVHLTSLRLSLFLFYILWPNCAPIEIGLGDCGAIHGIVSGMIVEVRGLLWLGWRSQSSCWLSSWRSAKGHGLIG